ncbi:EF-hand domain-containing protein [Lysobacter rhizosphaerae]
MDRFVTAVAVGTVLCGIAVAGLLLLTGTSTPAHAAEGAASAATAQAAAPRLFDTLDANKDQVLSRQEFQSGFAVLQRLVAMQVRLREQFGVLDANRSGAIEASEYANLELIRSQGKAAPSLAAFDADHDKKLGFAEYATLVRTLATGQASAKK